MFKLLFCMVFILTHSIAAQAGNLSGTFRLETKKWVTSYVGETEVDGLPVVVNFDEAQIDLQVPEVMARAKVDLGFDSFDSIDETPAPSTLVPFKAPTKQAYRLNFIVSHNPRIQSTYEIHPKTVSMDGFPRFAFVSNIDAEKLFYFVVTARTDGTMLVSYTRKVTEGAPMTGEIVLSPVARALAK